MSETNTELGHAVRRAEQYEAEVSVFVPFIPKSLRTQTIVSSDLTKSQTKLSYTCFYFLWISNFFLKEGTLLYDILYLQNNLRTNFTNDTMDRPLNTRN